MIATLAQAAPVSIEVGPGLGAVLIAAIAGLAGGVGYGVRWLMRQFEVQQEKFSLAIASQAASCAEEQAALIVAFERRCDRGLAVDHGVLADYDYLAGGRNFHALSPQSLFRIVFV